MVQIPNGTLMMGSPTLRVRSSKNKMGESPQHRVTVPEFLMGKYEVTMAQWRAVAQLPKVHIDIKPDLSPQYVGIARDLVDPAEFDKSKADWFSKFGRDNNPAIEISWEEAMEFCARLAKATGREYRLPSEAEWEYACRAGTQTKYAFGDLLTPRLAVYNGAQSTMPVGKRIANGFGLYDMHGNVAEWCLDAFHNDYTGAPVDGSAWLEGGDKSRRILRGGSWKSYPIVLRSAARYSWPSDTHYLTDDTGFRVVIAVTQ